MYKDISFDLFKENFINNIEKGYHPVYSSIYEDREGEFCPIVKIDLIDESRLVDGKIIFIQVPYKNEEEYQMIKKYLVDASNHLNKVIKENVNGLDVYNNLIKK